MRRPAFASLSTVPNVKEKEQVFDRVLMSVGRRPNSEIPGLDKTKVKVNQKGFIEINGQRQTADPTIYAIGDVAGEPMLAHKAMHEAAPPLKLSPATKLLLNRTRFPRSCSPIPRSRGPG